jgi:hypothetical protein
MAKQYHFAPKSHNAVEIFYNGRSAVFKQFRRGSSVVEHWSEKPGVVSSILTLGISFSDD